MLLVALPVAGMTVAAVVVQSHIASPEQAATLELGQMQSWIQVVGGPDPSRWQAVDQPWSTGVDTDNEGQPVNPVLPAPTSIDGFVPPDSEVLAVQQYGSSFVDTATGTARVAVTIGQTWSPLFEGRYAILTGTAPTNVHEAMVSPGMLERLGAAVGDDVTFTDSRRAYTITGTMRLLSTDPSQSEVFLPAGSPDGADAAVMQWYVADWQPSVAELEELNHAGFIAYARDLAVSPPAGANTDSRGSDSAVWLMVVLGSIIAVFCGYLVVLLAGAAFAVAARRQQRSLAVTASVGASRQDVFRIVLLQGTVLGAIGGVVGAATGIGIAAAFLAVTDNGVLTSFWGNWGVRIPWAVAGAILAFAVIVGTLSAIAPARGATRGDVLGALRGSRRPPRLSARRPLWALGLMISGLTATIVGAGVIAAFNTAPSVDYGNGMRVAALYGIVLGPVLFQVGILFGGHWTLSMLSRVLSRLGLSPRLASRDAAANPSRVVPAFAAIAACVFIASFALSMMALTAAGSDRNYSWNGPKDSIAVGMWAQSETDADAYVSAAEDLIAPTDPEASAVLWSPTVAPYDPQTGAQLDPDFMIWSVAGYYSEAGACTTCDPRANLASGNVSIIAPEELETVLGEALPASTVAAFRAGALLSLDRWGTEWSHDGTATIAQWTASGFEDYNNALRGYYEGSTDASALPEPTARHELPGVAISLARPQGSINAIISPDTARSLGMAVAPQMLYAVYSEPPRDDVVDALTAAAENVRVGESGSLNVTIERGPAPTAPWLWLICGVAMVLVVGAGAISLGLARFERRPDDATLTAVGGGRRLRRAINAWQAAILVGIGEFVGTIAGLIPVWGISLSSEDYLRFADTPWLWLGILAIGLPLIMTTASWLVPPRHPDLTRRTAIT